MSDLESRVGRLLRSAPLRCAPHSLEQRVLQEIARREALPWWRRKFSRWPRPAQACLATVCCLIIAGVLRADLPWPAGALAAVLQLVPPGLVYGAMAAAALVYTALFGLGAAAYRTLYLQPTPDELGP